MELVHAMLGPRRLNAELGYTASPGQVRRMIDRSVQLVAGQEMVMPQSIYCLFVHMRGIRFCALSAQVASCR
jgi:hypothetical protein